MGLSRRPAAAPAAAALAAATLAVSGCGGVATLAVGPPPPTQPAVASTTVPPLPPSASVSLPPVPGGSTTTSIAIGPGTASITGTVLGPAGPVAGATVEADRVVGAQVAMTQATTGGDGSFHVTGVLGGAYRLRAWQAPALGMATPQVLFVADGAAQQVSLQLAQYDGTRASADMAPSTVLLGNPAELVVSVTTQVVGPDGVVRPVPDPGQVVQVDGGASWAPLGPTPLTTGPDGTASLELGCTQAGSAAVVVTVTGTTPLDVQAPLCTTLPPDTTPPPTVPASPTVPTTVPGQGSGTGPAPGQGRASTTTAPAP